MGPSQMLIRDLHDRIGDIASDQRALALRHLTDLYLVGAEQFTSDDIALIDDIFIRLLEAIDDSARALLASRLAPVVKAPPRVLHRLACDDAIDVAAVLLRQSEALDDATLIECAVTKTQNHMLAISQRKTLSEAVTDVLVKRGDRDVVLSTAMNAGARFSRSAFTVLVKRARGDDALTGCVGRRPDLPQTLFERLLEAASDVVRATLERERRHSALDIDRAVTEVKEQIRSETTTQTQAQAAARVRVHSLNRAGKLNRIKLEEFAKRGNIEELTVALALMTHVPEDVVMNIFNDPDIKPILALTKTIMLPWETARNIIMVLPRSDGSPEADDLENVRVAFEQLHQPNARAILDARCARVQGNKPH